MYTCLSITKATTPPTEKMVAFSTDFSVRFYDVIYITHLNNSRFINLQSSSCSWRSLRATQKRTLQARLRLMPTQSPRRTFA